MTINATRSRCALSQFSIPAKDDDPCEVYLSDYKPVDGRLLPYRIEVRTGDKRYAVFTVNSYRFNIK